MGMYKDKTVVVTGGSRGIGLAIAKRYAKDGANVAILAKTAEPHPKLPGTIYTAASEIEEAGGNALPIQTDIRFDDQVEHAIDKVVDTFGTIDILINNASAIFLLGPEVLQMKQYDLMHQINGRGTYLCSTMCLKHLKNSENPHIVNISPPINLAPGWFKSHVAYTQSKYLMSMSTLGMAAAYKAQHIAVNSLWPRTAIDTAAVRNILPVDPKNCRKDTIMADAAYLLTQQKASETTGNFFIDEDFLREQGGIADFTNYACEPGEKLIQDVFIGDPKSIFQFINEDNTPDQN